MELSGFGKVHPDFLVLNPETRKEYCWEHFGMMDDKEYVRSAIQKLNAYEKNDIMPGNNLIISFETKTLPLNMKSLDNIIRTCLLAC